MACCGDVPTLETLAAAGTSDVVFLLDADNTLLDGDRIVNDLRAYLKGAPPLWSLPSSCPWCFFSLRAARTNPGIESQLLDGLLDLNRRRAIWIDQRGCNAGPMAVDELDLRPVQSGLVVVVRRLGRDALRLRTRGPRGRRVLPSAPKELMGGACDTCRSPRSFVRDWPRDHQRHSARTQAFGRFACLQPSDSTSFSSSDRRRSAGSCRRLSGRTE